jgi:hypothetical protein
LVTLQNVEIDVGLQLPQANCTQMHGFLCAFLQMVAAVHQTFKEHAMPHPKHVSDLMRHDSNRSVFDELVVNVVLFGLKELLVIPGERKDPRPFPNARQSKYKIPLIPWVEVGHTDADHAESIGWQLWLKVTEDIPRVELRLLCVLVYASSYTFEGFELFGYLYFHGMKEALAIPLQLLHELFADLF